MAKYNKKTVDSIVGLIKSDTYTIAEICQMNGISPATFHRWRIEHEEFDRAINEAEDERMQKFVAEAKKSLLKRIQGYEVTETKVVTVPMDGDASKPMIKEQTTQKKHVAPDTTAIIFALTNGDPSRWKNKHSAEVSVNPFLELMQSLPDSKDNGRGKG